MARLRAAGVDRDVIKALVGHADKDVTAGYGRIEGALFPIDVLNDAVQKVRVDGLDLRHLHRPRADAGTANIKPIEFGHVLASI